VQLSTLTVRNFRNLAAIDVQFPPEGAVVLGPNGHGKTNLLEAIYFLVLFRSFRSVKDRELVRFGADGFFVAGERESGRAGAASAARITAGYQIQGARKKVTVDGREVQRLSQAVGTLTAVVFSPADRELVAGGPAQRRRYLDVLLSLTTPGYLAALGAMRNALKQRNAALRRAQGDAARAFDQPLAGAAARVAAARQRWTESWCGRYRELARGLGEVAPAAMSYHQRHPEDEQDVEHLRRALAQALDRDLRRGMTTVGPHRDDLALTLDGRELRRYGSAGQQRTAAVTLRLLEAEALRAARGSQPIALYDDVFAELDADRQARLLGQIQAVLPGQAIVTAPRESEVPGGLLERARWRIWGGQIER
jgi:DNA replication and repair protein RecF